MTVIMMTLIVKRKDADDWKVALVEVHHATTKTANNVETTTRTQHFNLVIVDDATDQAYLFEPLLNGDARIAKLVSAHFTEYKLRKLTSHPQKNLATDNFCMAYVCLLAKEVIADGKLTETKFERS